MPRFSSLDELFEGRHFDREIIVLCVWQQAEWQIQAMADRLPATGGSYGHHA